MKKRKKNMKKIAKLRKLTTSNIYKEEKGNMKNLNYMTLYKLQAIADVEEFGDTINPERLAEQKYILDTAILDFMQGRISWSAFSTKFSYSAYALCKSWQTCELDKYRLGCNNNCNLSELKTTAEPVAYRIHQAWVQAYKIAKRLIELGYELDGTNAEKVKSQEKLLCNYDELSREEQLKDIYTFKGFYINDEKITEPNAWNKYFSTEEIEKGFIKYNINW